MFGRNDFLGEVMMALENKVFDDPTPKWYNLQERVGVLVFDCVEKAANEGFLLLDRAFR